jgi:hypothetical protein
MPSRPYFHGDEELYALDGFLIAHSKPHPIPSGMSIETAKVLTLDQRYDLASWYDLPRFEPQGIVWRTSRGDTMRPATLAEVMARCREVFGGNPRYAIGSVCE